MKKFLALIIMLVFSACAWAQVDHPVKWSYASKKINDKEVVVFLKATIEKGWHIYSLASDEDSPVKTSFAFISSQEYKLVGKTIEPKPVIKYEPVLKMNVGYFENSVVFQQKIKLASANVSSVKGKLEYMACNDHKCNPSEEIEFNIPLSN